MLKRRNIRALVVIDPIDFFYDNGQPMGAMYEPLREFEKFVNDKEKTGALKVKVTFIPVRPDQAEAALLQGVGISLGPLLWSRRKGNNASPFRSLDERI